MTNMDGLPIDVDFGPLNGRLIEVLRISKYQVHYFLNNERPNKPDVWIEIGGKIIIIDPDGTTTEIEDYRANGGLLCFLLGLTIEKAHRREDGGLVLEITDGYRLEVPIDTPKYESVVLHIGDKAIVG
jgi:hypothetical protein